LPFMEAAKAVEGEAKGLLGSMLSFLSDGGEARYVEGVRLEHRLEGTRSYAAAVEAYAMAAEAGHPLAGAALERIKLRAPLIRKRQLAVASVREKLSLAKHKDREAAKALEMLAVPAWLEARRAISGTAGGGTHSDDSDDSDSDLSEEDFRSDASRQYSFAPKR